MPSHPTPDAGWPGSASWFTHSTRGRPECYSIDLSTDAAGRFRGNGDRRGKARRRRLAIGGVDAFARHFGVWLLDCSRL